VSAEGAELLRLLASGPGSVGAVSRVRPVGGQTPGGSASVEGADFAELLRRAEDGELTSGVPVTVEKGAGIELGEAELLKLTLAADKAEAAGIRRALVFTDSQALIMDVQSRTIVGAAEMKDGVAAGVDGVIRLGAGPSSVEAERVLGVPGGFAASNPSLAALLGERGESAR
jgi:hypothetical protein